MWVQRLSLAIMHMEWSLVMRLGKPRTNIILRSTSAKIVDTFSDPNSTTLLSHYSYQVSYGDHTPMVHHSGFLHGRLEEVLPVAMAASKRRVEFERRVLAQHSKISQDHSQTGDSQVHIQRVCTSLIGTPLG